MYIFKGGHRTDRHSPSWNAVCRKESSKRRQRPSAQHWGSPPTTSSQPLGVFRPGGEERMKVGRTRMLEVRRAGLGGAALNFRSPTFPLTHPFGSPVGGERRRQFARTGPGCAPKSPLHSPVKLPPPLADLLWARDAPDESTDQPRLAPHLETPEAQPWDPWTSREAGSDLHPPQRQGLLQLRVKTLRPSQRPPLWHSLRGPSMACS